MSKHKACARCGEAVNDTAFICSKCGSRLFDFTENKRSTDVAPAWRKKMAELMKEEMNHPEEFWWLSFCDPDKPKGTQFIGAIVVKAHGITDALTKCNAMMINSGGEVKGAPIPITPESESRLTPEVLNRLISKQDMIDWGWEPVSMGELNA